MLAKFTLDKRECWDERLDACVYAYNTSVHESTCFTPFELMYGRRAVLPVDINIDEREAEDLLLVEEEDNAVNDAVEAMTKKRVELLDIAKCNILKAQKKQKEAYDKKHACPSAFEINQLVLKEDKRRKKRAGGKLDERYTGPYRIIKKFGKGIFSLELLLDPTEIVDKVSGVHLKIYKNPTENVRGKVCTLYVL